MISFDNLSMLFLFFIIPFIIAIHYFALVHFKKRFFKFANFDTLKRLSEKERGLSKNMGVLLIRVVFLAVFILALSGPGIEITQQGIPDQIVFAVDVSGSMFAEDILPTRLEASKDMVIDFMDNASLISKVGIVTFTSIVYLEQDMTDDYVAVRSAVERINVRKTTGTSLGNAISFSTGMFEDDDNIKSLVIITDGQENFMNSEELIEITAHVTARDINIFILGVGSDVGGAFRNEAAGTSVLNEDSIKLIAEENDGAYAFAKSADEMAIELGKFFTETSVKRVFPIEFWLYVLAVILLIIEWYFVNYFSRAFP